VTVEGETPTFFEIAVLYEVILRTPYQTWVPLSLYGKTCESAGTYRARAILGTYSRYVQTYLGTYQLLMIWNTYAVTYIHEYSYLSHTYGQSSYFVLMHYVHNGIAPRGFRTVLCTL